MTPSELRNALFDAYGPECEWPGCTATATESAHLHSIGMGGSTTRNDPGNAMIACWYHARVTDGEGANRFRDRHPTADTMRMFRTVGYPVPAEAGRMAWHRAEALAGWLAKSRPFTIGEETPT